MNNPDPNNNNISNNENPTDNKFSPNSNSNSNSLYRIQPVILQSSIGKTLKLPGKTKSPSSISRHSNASLKTQWKSIYLGAAITTMSAMQFSLYFTSLWPFLKVLDPTTTEAFFGVVIAAYSFSQIIASPLFGYWSNRIRCLKLPLEVCACFAFTGNAIYFFTELIPINPRYTLVIARFVSGIGATTIGLMKAYASSASVSKDRSRAIAFVTGGMAVGTTAGPGLQLLFTGIGYPGWKWGRGFGISMFNAPALFCCCLNIISFTLLKLFFYESFVGVIDKGSKKKDENHQTERTVTIPKSDRLAIYVCYALRFTQMFVVTNLETIGASYAMMMFTWNAQDVVFYTSIAHALKSFLAFSVYFIYIAFNMGRRVSDRLVCLGSLGILFIFHVVTYSWPFLPNQVRQYNSTALGNTTTMGDGEAVGCDVAIYSWCESLTQVNVYIYYFFMCVTIGLAGSNINVTLNTLFSKIIGPRLQGTQQGLLQMSGGSARMMGPLIVGVLYSASGPRLTWILELIVVGVMILLWCVAYKRLVPLVVPPELLTGEPQKQYEVPTTAMLTDDLQKSRVRLSQTSLSEEDLDSVVSSHDSLQKANDSLDASRPNINSTVFANNV